MAGTTGLEPAASAVTGQRSNQLNYVPTLFSYRYRKTACLAAFLSFMRLPCVTCFNPQNPIPRLTDTVDTMQTAVQKCAAGKHQPRAAVPAP